jgi:signal transduction histidine kinase
MKAILDPHSIHFRLTVGMVLASILGIGGLTGWVNLRMRQLLVDNHKENALVVADRLGDDVALYDTTQASSQALSMAIDYREQADVAIWVRSPQGNILAQSKTLTMGSWQVDNLATEIMKIAHERAPSLEVIHLNDDQHFILCASPLMVQGENLGMLYIVDDISEDHKSLSRVTQTLALSSLLAIGLGAITTSLYISRALQPIRNMNRIAASISTDNLASTHLQIENPPTEVKELAQTCNMMIARISAAWEQQRRFVSDVSHELRTPLTLVQGYLQSTLRRSDNLSAPQREGLEIAAEEADRTIRLLQDLLDLARADGGHLRFHLKSEPLAEVVQEVLGMRPSQRIQAELAPVEAWVDRHRLKQVIINLIDNALKYSEADRLVQVRLSGMGDGEAFQGNRAYIEIEDSGRGIPPADLPKIFEPFYRVDEDRSRATGGTGLGLSIVKTLVEGMNGTLKVQSKLGQGSIFTVSLPIRGKSTDS